MFDPEFQRKALSLIMSFIIEFSGASGEPEPVEMTADNLNVSTVSVSCLKVTWDSEPHRDYYVSCTAHDDNYAYADNMYFTFKGNDLCYITGLREGTEYTVTVEPVLSDEEQDVYTAKSASARPRAPPRLPGAAADCSAAAYENSCSRRQPAQGRGLYDARHPCISRGARA